MKLNYLPPVLATVGFIFASYSVVSSNKPMPVAQAVAEPASAPFNTYIAGSGIIEAKSRNITIGTPLSGIVTRLAVKVGDNVKMGTVLFALDDRETLADLAVKQADLVKAQAQVKMAQASLQDAQSLSQLAIAVTDKRAISREELLRRHNTVEIAEANLSSALASAQQAEAAVKSVKTTLDRLIVRAPVDSQILQINIRPGEFAQASGSNSALMILGNLDQLHVRVDIDENDAWRFNMQSQAVAYLRGNRNFKVDLQPAYIEPYVIPKVSLTGDSSERVDTRVLQVLYSFDRRLLPVYVGQQMDVFIEAKDSPNGTESGTP